MVPILTYIGMHMYVNHQRKMFEMATVPKITAPPQQYTLQGFSAFIDVLDAIITVDKPATACASMALFDIDFFGKINKAHGRETGDACITALGEHLTRSLRDTAEVYRYGGDAFAALFSGVDKERAFLEAETARTSFGESAFKVKTGIELTLSAGVAAWPDDAASAQMVVRKCTEALYRAKVSGRDRVCLAREEKMVTKTSHYAQGQLEGLARLAKREGMNEAALLREALDDLLRKHNS